MPSEACIEELETLSAIFLDEINIDDDQSDGGALVSMVLYPATGDDEESRYVTVTVEISLCRNYPKVPPKIVFRNPRGLNDLKLDELLVKMKSRCEDRLESQMIYELIDMAREFLTWNNRPASECPICLLSFTEFDVFFRSHCFHYFHSNCLGNYLQNLLVDARADATIYNMFQLPPKKTELLCPVCREELEKDIDVQKLVAAPPPSEETEVVATESATVLQDWEGKRQSMQELFDKQKSQGGIIDLTDKNKKLLVISSPQANNAAVADTQSSGVETVTVAVGNSANRGMASATSIVHAHDQGGGGGGRHPLYGTGRQRNDTHNQFHRQNNSVRPGGSPPRSGNPSLGVSSNTTHKANNSGPTGEGSDDQATAAAETDNRAGNGNGHYKKRGGGGYNRRRHK